MKIFLKVKPSAYEPSIEKVNETHFTVAVKEPPVNGLANRGVIIAMAKYFNIAPTRVRIVSGFSSRQKVIVID